MTQSEAEVVKLLKSVISTGQSVREKVSIEDVRAFIEAQPEVLGQVVISDIRGASEVGASSGVLSFTAAYEENGGRVQRDLILRYAPVSQRLFYEYDMARQFRVQGALQRLTVPVPRPLWLDGTGDYIGMPGFIMVRHPGEAPSPSAFAYGPIARADPEARERMLDAVTSALVEMHGLDYVAAGLGDFEMPASGVGAMEKYVNWYWRTWEWHDLPVFEKLASTHRWLLQNAATDGFVLTHGDATLHNYMFVGETLTGVIDWEMSCIGRPESDIAIQCNTSHLFAAPSDSGLPQPPSETEWIDRYYKAGGRALDNLYYYNKLATYITIICVEVLRGKMEPSKRSAQDGLVDRLWRALEA